MPRPLGIDEARPADWELSADADWTICERLLPLVSRTFALSIQMLPPSLSRSVSIAYLVCRIADTIEDDARIPTVVRAKLLEAWRLALSGNDVAADAATEDVGRTIEEQLVLRCRSRVLGEYYRLPVQDRQSIERWSSEMINGMIVSLSEKPQVLTPSFNTIAELEQYCYYVAGTIGHMLTDLFMAHAPQLTPAARDELELRATNFGLGLQLTNVIRDVEADRDEYRVWIPAELWSATGLAPADLFSPGRVEDSWRVLDPLCDRANRYLDDAFAYAVRLPAGAWRIRLFCFSQVFFARRTLSLLARNRRDGVPSATVKIRRIGVYAIVAATFASLRSNRALTILHGRLRAA